MDDGRAYDAGDWAVVVLNWNRPDDTITCLQSLRAAHNAPRRVILVDNASTDDSVARIEAWADHAGVTHVSVAAADATRATLDSDWWLLTIVAASNDGFAPGNNLALRLLRDYTGAPYVLLLNNDTAVAPDFFDELMTALHTDPDVGLVTGTIYEWDRRTVWYAGGRVNPLRALVVHELDLPLDPSPRPTDFVCGCTMLISRAVLEQVGLLPECYRPFYGEDADYSLRARAAGFTALYAPRATVYHRVGSALGRNQRAPLVTFCLNRHRAFIVRRNYRGWERAAGLAYLAITKPARALLELGRGRPRTAWAVLTGAVAGLFSPAARTS